LEKLGEDAVYRILLRALKVLRESKGGEVASEGKGKGKEVNEDSQERVEIDVKPKTEPSLSQLNSTAEAIDSSQDDNAQSHPTASNPHIDESILATYPSLDSSLLRFLASAADGDARVALSSLELALSATKDGNAKVDREELKKGLRKAHLQYDRSGGMFSTSLIHILLVCSYR